MPTKPVTCRKPQGHAALDALTPEQEAELRERFKNIRFTLRQGRALVGTWGIQCGPNAVRNWFFRTFKTDVKSRVTKCAMATLSPDQLAAVRQWFAAAPRLSFRAAAARVLADFGVKVSESSMFSWWHKEHDPLPASAAKSVELSLTVREGETVTGTTSLKLPLHKPPEAPAQ